jgi:hypothetical protein
MKRSWGITIAVLALLAVSLGCFRREYKRVYVNAVAVCYSCIGLE